jgi:DNA-binding CsgD family transcriptional regulator
MVFDEYRVEDALALREKEGRELTLRENISRLFKHGMSPDWIAEVLELPLETVLRYVSE